MIYTYTELVDKIRNVYEYADARNIFEHIAVQINLSGEGAGILYMEVAGRAITVEPYDYKDRDGEIFADGLTMIKLLEEGIGFAEAYEKGLISYSGNEKKLKALKNIRFPAKKSVRTRRREV